MKVYVSSTFADLEQHREAVYKILRKGRHDVIAMEDYVAGDVRPLDQCLQDVADSDLYVGVFAWRYGFIPKDGNPDQKSITELEYRKAVDSGKDVLVFLLKDDAPWNPAFMDSHTGEGAGGANVRRLRDELGEKYIRSQFSTPDELASLVSAAVGLVATERAHDRAAEMSGVAPQRAGAARTGGRAETKREPLERVFKDSERGFYSIKWWGRAVNAARSVAKITGSGGAPVGTGFLLAGNDVHPTLGTEPVVVTASFVVGATDSRLGAIPPDEALITFEAAERQSVTVADVLWQSAVSDLATAVLRLAPDDLDVAPLTTAPQPPPLEGDPVSFIIGYPHGGGLRFSIGSNAIIDYDDRTMHYRTPTEPGSSGSPVFDDTWRVMAMHFAGSRHMSRLHGEGSYPANAGIRLDAILAAIGSDFG